MKLTTGELQLARKLEDAGVEREEARDWVTRILTRRDRRNKKDQEVFHIIERDGNDIAWCGATIKNIPMTDEHMPCRECNNIMYERLEAMNAALGQLGDLFRDNVTASNDVWDNLTKRWADAVK